MTNFEWTSEVPLGAETTYLWHAQPGALTRLSPHWAQEIVEESYPPIAPGSVAQVKTSVPGSYGLVRRPFSSVHAEGPSRFSFVDELKKGPLSQWKHTHEFFSVAGGTKIDDHIEFSMVPSGLDSIDRSLTHNLEATFEARQKRMLMDIEFLERMNAPLLTRKKGKRILIAGGSGLIGRQVAALFSTAGHFVRLLVRRTPKFEYESHWNPDLGIINPRDLAWADAVVHLGGKSIATRFTKKAKEGIRSSRIDSTSLLAETMRSLPEAKRPKVFVCASAVGVYGSEAEVPVDESAPAGDGFLAEVCQEWEAAAARVEDAGIRRVSIRTGVVLTSLSGFLKLQAPLYLAGAGGRLGSGEQGLAWVSLDDVARAYVHAALTDYVRGPVNAVAPDMVSQAEFAEALAAHLRRPARIPTPSFVTELVLGRDGAKELALADQKVLPERLEETGYQFAHPTLSDCLEEELGDGA
ncbi:MAG: TIGR01777 family oxidoreductase [Brevibacterium sp.]|uniref:TIGR01777 family oxidoreductase n=1 Tax=Brevibacterium sp. TaxID=1701 RepID=UPI00264756FA|nr:TIGR01777 family oxidoreductase [Brevibacterium sp.]MDN5807995.1 TIGR01777 family oxidoreductase [Brevibacterium sp.]MDN5877546.1 TIGR01777 family oxidoreductase [Brevibacterium sp.]MDN6134439.1 TIGR01777 family oxidoreductase [Brevibacterium sp.]MDN6158708.1 TIGR01777 family oxidoreductase [Brevibacterium sp.]MDN6176451.1 TIGR01777 family oxidoreductase [Brevibacterium sp.]